MTGDRAWLRIAGRAAALAPNPEDDLALVASVHAGDTDAIERILRENNRALFNTARAILLDDAQAEDVVQDAYVKAFHDLDSFRAETTLSSWLVRIAAREALTRRCNALRPALPRPLPGRDVAGDGGMRWRVERCIDRLPDLERVVFVMVRIERMHIGTVSFALDMGPAAVRRNYVRALARVRAWFAREELSGLR